MLVPFLHSFQGHCCSVPLFPFWYRPSLSLLKHHILDPVFQRKSFIFRCHLPGGTEFRLALTHFLVTAKLATIGPSPFCVLEAPGSGSSIISALLGVKGKMVSFPRLLGQQTHISLRSIRQLPGRLRQCALCLPAAGSVVDLHPSS